MAWRDSHGNWGVQRLKSAQMDGLVKSSCARRVTGLLPASASLWAGPREAIEKQAPSLPGSRARRAQSFNLEE